MPQTWMQAARQADRTAVGGFWHAQISAKLNQKIALEVGCCRSDKGRDTGVAIIHVDDRSYEFTIPSSLFKCVHGRADNENPHRFRGGEDLFKQLLKTSD